MPCLEHFPPNLLEIPPATAGKKQNLPRWNDMKTRVLAMTAAMIVMGMLSALHAQTVVISPEQEVVIQKYVAAHTVTSVDVPNVDVVVGTALPETVELHRIDAPDVTYSYVVVNGKTAIVDPGTRKVIRIMN